MINKLGQVVDAQIAITGYGYEDIYSSVLMEDLPQKKMLPESRARKHIASYLMTGDRSKFLKYFDEENANEYLFIAKELNLKDIKEICENELLDRMQPHESLSTFLFSRAHGLQKLEEYCLRLIEIHFESLSVTEEFQYLGQNDILELYQNPAIIDNACSGIALDYWYEYEKEPRNFMNEKIRNLLRAKTKEPIICKPDMLIGKHREKQYIAMFTCDTYDYNARPFAVVMELGTFKYTKIRLDKIGNCGPEFGLCLQQKDVTFDPYVYFTGGKEKSSRRTFRGDAILGKWKELKKLKVGRSRHCSAVVNKKVYVLGGFQDFGCKNISSIEEYGVHQRESLGLTLDHKNWKIVGNLAHKVRSAGCGVYGNKIYVFGGVLEDKTEVSYIQKFDPKTREVKVIGQLPVDCCCCKVVVLGDNMYIVSVQGHVVQFNPNTGKCSLLSQHPETKIRHFAVFTDGHDIFTAGGCFGENSCINDIYKYCVNTNTWEKLKHCLPNKMAVYGQCNIKIQSDWNFVPLIK